MKDGGYAGKIKNGGTQVVQAPKQTTDQKKGTVKKGGDLRAGKKQGPSAGGSRQPEQGTQLRMPTAGKWQPAIAPDRRHYGRFYRAAGL